MKNAYACLKQNSEQSSWEYKRVISDLRKQLEYMKSKRVNKNRIRQDLDDFNKRGYDMLNWYKKNRFNHTNEFIQFQRETEFLFNDVLNYFNKKFIIDNDHSKKYGGGTNSKYTINIQLPGFLYL